MGIAILYISFGIIYIALCCLDGEDTKPKWKKWLADELGIKPQVEVRHYTPQAVQLLKMVSVSRPEIDFYVRRGRKEELEALVLGEIYDSIRDGMAKNNLVKITKRECYALGDIIYEGRCNVYKPIYNEN